MVAHLRINQLLSAGWSFSKGGRMRVEQSLLAESWNPTYTALGFNADDKNPPFLAPAVEELVTSDGRG
jgi:type I restriction enzyme R subunit